MQTGHGVSTWHAFAIAVALGQPMKPALAHFAKQRGLFLRFRFHTQQKKNRNQEPEGSCGGGVGGAGGMPESQGEHIAPTQASRVLWGGGVSSPKHSSPWRIPVATMAMPERGRDGDGSWVVCQWNSRCPTAAGGSTRDIYKTSKLAKRDTRATWNIFALGRRTCMT